MDCKLCFDQWKKTADPTVQKLEEASEIADQNCLKVGDDEVSCNGFSTPKARRFRIPERIPCPPAPKKKRRLSPVHCSYHRPAVSFFTHPELELFFLVALHDIRV
ncbi:hypothetical protein M5K25_008789 [Dendrobium thyrsiflorum]|uniref:Uncharacterized protein n=1 Tax=Dendrobium thyrsiflorum TaxID=117978 RepID=A0ABD0V9E9_DENTH